MNNMRNTLLQQDGLDPAGVTEQELTQFRMLLAQEQKRVKRFLRLLMISGACMALILLGLCVSESVLETLNIPFVTASGIVVIGIWIVIIPVMRRIGRRLEQSTHRITDYQQVLPECQAMCARGIPMAGRMGQTRFLYWPGLLLVALIIWVISMIVGHAIHLLLTQSFSQFWSVTRWQSGFAVLIFVGMVRGNLIIPLTSLRELDQSDTRFWIRAPRIAALRIPPLFWKTGLTGLLGFIGVLSVYLFFQGNDVYGRALAAMRDAQSIRAVGYGFEDGQRVKTSEIRYQADKGTHIQWFRGDQIIDMYDDGQYRYDFVQGNRYVVKKNTEQPLLPRELTELPRYLKWTRRDPDRDKHIETVVQGHVRYVFYKCYKREDSDNLSLMWMERSSGTPRFRQYEEYKRVDGKWEQVELIEVDYDEPMDLIMPPEVFEQQGIKIVEPETVSRAEYSLERALATTEVLGLTFAVQDLKRWGDTLLLTCSVRATDQSLRERKKERS
ncbi:MAG: hypothetical protein K9N55_20030 [Phycisphaerae bacterium]|nr:hypothetical protein [Phycisphaerae bacterium]